MTNAPPDLPATPPGALNRRDFVLAGAAAGLAWGGSGPAEAGAATPLEAYARATSVVQGGTLAFCARDPAGSMGSDKPVTVAIARISHPADVLMQRSTVALRNCSVPADASSAGCGWPVSLNLAVPAGWPSGLYYAVFGVGAQACTVPFVVTAASPTPGTRLLVQVPVNTTQAYNSYGGKSLYGFNSTGGVPASRVSFDRPHTLPWNFASDRWQASLVRWLVKNNIAADFCTSIDLHQAAGLLAGYPLLVIGGHDEYWSRDMRERLDAFVAAGGNAAILGGNTCWWQVRLEPNAAGVPHRSLVCHKDAATDPDPRPAYKTVNWINLQPPEPENTSIGLGWNLGASWTVADPRPDTPWVVQRARHWVFAGTGLATGGGFGGAYSGHEIDAMRLCRGGDGRVYPAFGDGTPTSMTVLAVADASQWNALSKALGGAGEKSGWGVVGIFSRGGTHGTVFNAGACDWVYGLQPELDGLAATPLSRITWNVLTRLQGLHRECTDVRRHANVQANGDGVRYFLTCGNDAPAGATLDGVAFRAFAEAAEGTVPVYRYRYPQSNGDGTRHYYSISPNWGNGWILDCVAFHAYATPQPGTVPVYKYHFAQTNGDGWRFLFSTYAAEGGGWLLDNVVFHVPVA